MKESKLALGTAQFGLDYGISNARGKIPKKEAFEILRLASSRGVKTIDTAQGYGESESVIGEFIGLEKASFRIVSKLSKESLKEPRDFLEKSLARLNSKKLYGLLFHDFDSFRQDTACWDKMEGLKAEGKIEKTGFSLYYPHEAEYIIAKGIPADIVQVPYSVFDQRFAGLFPMLKKRGIEIHARSVFLQGLVFKSPESLGPCLLPVKEKLLELKRISGESRLSVAGLCINFAAKNPLIDRVVVGVGSLENFRENLSLLGSKKIEKFYPGLLDLKEDNEKIILPFNWGKV